MSIVSILKENPNFIISVIGPHAGEDLETIFKRKINDIKQYHYTYWICKSRVISPEIISAFQEFNNQSELFMIFIKTAKNSLGKDTNKDDRAQYVKENDKWVPLDQRLSPLTGKMPTNGFKFGEINLVQGKWIDLNEYVEWEHDKTNNEKQIQIMMGKSTLCIRKSNKKQKMKNSVREIVGYARLIPPYCLKFTKELKELTETKIQKRKGKTFQSKEIIKKKIKLF